MKYTHNLTVKIVIALIIGFLFAGISTTINYTCAPIDGAAGCASFEKAIMHPSDLFENKQNSLVYFSTTFAITAIVVFAVLSIVSLLSKKSQPVAKQKQ